MTTHRLEPVLRRFSIAALVTAGAFCAGVMFGWMLNENEHSEDTAGGG